MRIEATIWTATAVFFLALAVIYAAVGGESAGTTLLGVAFGFGGIVAVWLWIRGGGRPPLPEDRADAEMVEEAGEVGVFVTTSWRPVGIAVGVTVALVGLVVGPWMAIIGAGFAMVHVVGLVVDG